jgi:SRSO17 transposase
MDGTADDIPWAREFDTWLAPFLDVLGDPRRKPWLPIYVRGLLSPSERKSLTPMATHVATQMGAQDATAAKTHYHNLQQFITYSDWDVAPVLRLLAQRADAMLGGPDAVLIVDDTALTKKGHHSVGVAHQYCGEVGKLANCQCLVSLTLAKNEVPIPLALQLYLPREWTGDAARCEAVGVPNEIRKVQHTQTKIDLSLAEIARVRESGVRFGLVTADAAYGTSAVFRHAISAMGGRYAVGVQSHARVYSIDATIEYPPRRTVARTSTHRYEPARPRLQITTHPKTAEYAVGRRRVRPVASEPSQTVAEMLRGAHWQTIRWRRGTKDVLHGRYTAIRVRVADGDEGRRSEHMPGEIVWLVGEQQPDGRRRYYFTNHTTHTSLHDLVRAIRSRWVCEQAHLQLKQELGLDHFEGRSWRGLEHHVTLTMLSFAFLQHLRLHQDQARSRKKNQSTTTGPAAITLTADGPACPHCETLLSDADLSPLQPVTHLSSDRVRKRVH